MHRHPRSVVPIVMTLVAAAALTLPANTASASSSKPSAPTVSDPVTGGQGFPSLLGTNIEPSSVGYVRDEYFLEGEATAYEPRGTLGANGKWKVTEADTAPYKTRIVVYKPADPADFSGTVFVEWVNVSAGFDNAIDWINTHNQIIRSGGAYVAVSAQAVGVQGGGRVLEGASAGGLKGGDPERYGTLSHPGDEYSYDIFTQAGVVASGDSDTVNPFEGYDVQRVIAAGESQSAYRMTSYVNGVQPLVGVYDGFLIHSRGGSAAGFGTTVPGQDDPTVPDVVRIRTDLDEPVFTFETETDLASLGCTPSRQADTKRTRTWEGAGTSHADAYTGALGITDIGDGTAEHTLLDPAQASGGPLSCAQSVNAGAQFAPLSAAYAHLEDWVRDGTAPPKGARIKTTGTGETVAIVRDEQGNAVGGVRTPLVDVPLAANTGDENPGGRFCRLFGTTAPFDAATLAALYPDGTAEWREKFAKATDAAVEDGYWLEPEAEHFKAASEQISFG